MAETIDLEFRADMRDLKKKLAELPKDTAKAANKAVNEINAAMKAAEKRALKLAKAEAKATHEAKKLAAAAGDIKKRGTAGLDAMKQAAEGMGGKIGGAAGMIEKFGRSASQMAVALGPTGLALAGVTAAAVGLVAGIGLIGLGLVKLIGASEVWIEELDEMGGKEFITDRHREEIKGASLAVDGLTMRYKAMGVQASGESASSLTVLAALFSRFTSGVEGVTLAIRFLVQQAMKLSLMLTGMNYDQAHTALEGLRARIHGARDAMTDAHMEEDKWIQAIKRKEKADKRAIDLADATSAARKSHAADLARIAGESRKAEAASRAWAASQRESAAAAAAAAAVQEQLRKTIETSTNGLAAITLQAQASELSAAGKVNAVYDRRMDRIQELSKIGVESAAIAESVAAVELAREKELNKIKVKNATDLAKKEADANAATIEFHESMDELLEQGREMQAEQFLSAANAIADIAGQISGYIGEFGDARMESVLANVAAEQDAAAKTRDAWLESEQARLDSMTRRRGFSEKDAVLEQRRIDEEIKAKNKAIRLIAKEEQKALKQGFKTSQAAALAQVAVDAASATIAMIPAYVPLAGPGAPFAAGIAAATAAGISIQQILSTPPPSFATGGAVGDRMQADHGLISAKSSEGIVSDRGMAALGRDGLNAINAGGAASTTVQVILDQRVIASSVIDALSNDPQVGSTLNARSGIPTGRALVYGQG